jgi:hypothetical protein
MTGCKSALESFANDKKIMLGGGYSVNVEDQIAGMATYNGYDDVNVHNVSKGVAKKLVGGAKKASIKKKKTSKRKVKSTLPKKDKKGNTNKGNKSGNTNKPKTKKRTSTKRKSKRQQGGNAGDYPFNGDMNDHSPDTMNKNYGGKQPVWDVKTR